MGPDDEYLRHVLRVHGADILQFQPDFVWDGAAPGRLAFLVQRGDETVGVVLVRDDGDGVAQVLLDYVTPRYRDFSPGEFVWRRSNVLRDHGFTRVVTPADMVGAYYGAGLGLPTLAIEPEHARLIRLAAGTRAPQALSPSARAERAATPGSI